MSPRSRGRPAGRGRPRRPARRPARSAGTSADPLGLIAEGLRPEGEPSVYWFDDPVASERFTWVMPPGHGTFLGLDLELLDPTDDDDLMMLIEAQHPEFAEALRGGQDIVADGEPMNPRLHVALHQIVANQLLANDPPETWPTVQRLARLGYDWHNVMHMIASVVSDDIHTAMTERRSFDAADHSRRLDELPGDWPPPEKL